MAWFSSTISKIKPYVKPNYYRLHWLYITAITFLGAIAVFYIEGIPFEDSLFMAASAVSGTGLSTVDLAKWHWISQAVLPVLMVLGSPILMTLVPVFFRRLFFRRKFTKEQRDRSPEYKALRAIFRIVVLYFVLNHLLCIAILTLWGQFAPSAHEILEARGQRSYQWATFLVFSAFGNSGFTTFQDNMMVWNRSPLPLLIVAYLTLAGNTAFPVFTRVIVWFRYVTGNKKERLVYKHLLKHPRRYFTHLFLPKQTWWLFVTLVVINLLQFVAFLAMDWNSAAVEGMSIGQKLLNSFFSSIVTRTSGFNSIDISLLTPSMLVLYAAMMYISSTPVVATMRTTEEGEREVEEEVEDELQHAKEAVEEVLEIHPEDGDIPLNELVLHPRQPEPMPETLEEDDHQDRDFSLDHTPAVPTHTVDLEAITERALGGGLPQQQQPLDPMTEISANSTTGMLEGAPEAKGRKYHLGQLSFDSKGANFGKVTVNFNQKISLGKLSGKNMARHLQQLGRRRRLSEENEGITKNQYDDDDEGGSVLGEGPLLLIPKTDKAMRTQTKMLLTQDTIVLFTILFLICFLDRQRLMNDGGWEVFKVIFEMASAYGTVGLSLGYPGLVTSFSTVMSIASKVLMSLVMLMGRHRGLPTSIDQAIQLKISDEIIIPSESKGTAVVIGGNVQPQLQSTFNEEVELTPEERSKRRQLEKEMLKKRKKAVENIRSMVKEQEKAQKERQNVKSNGGEFRGMELAQFDVTDVRLNLDDLPEDKRQEAMLKEASEVAPPPSTKKNLKVQQSYAQLMDDLDQDGHDEKEEEEASDKESDEDDPQMSQAPKEIPFSFDD